MLQLMLLLLLVPLSSCDALSHDADDKTVSEEEYNAMKLLWEQEHKGVVDHLEVKRSKIKPSYIRELHVNNHHLEMLDLSTLHHHTSHEQPEHHKTSHDQPEHHKTSHEQRKIATVDRSRRQGEHLAHVGSGSGSAMMCVDPPMPSNGGYVSNGSVLTYMCEEGFVLIGNRVRYCNLTTWMFNGSDPTCEACVDPPALINGSFISNGSVVTYMCEEGFALIGNRQRFCNFKTLMFNGSDPTCEGPCEQDEPFSGSCDTVRPQYYYSATQDRCLPFDGCQATRRGHNSYDSLMMCRDTCTASCNDSEGMERLHRAVWTNNDCEVCECDNGIISCQPVDCPVVIPCEGNSTPVIIEGECCPVCPPPEIPVEIPVEIPDGSCQANNITYNDGEVFMMDLCTTCQCNNGTINCTTETCTNCPQGTSPVNDRTQCCPVCLPELTSCELMENDPEILTLFEVCTSVTPVVLHSCPEQCVANDDNNDNVFHCCITTYFTNSTQFECANLPGVMIELKFLDANDCTCVPCG